MGKFIFVVVVLVGIWVTWTVNSPYTTKLPWRLSDMNQVQEQLDRLDPKEKQLVIDYMIRSNGDRVPASIGDPDSPFTANTFNEAIQLEKDYQERHPRQPQPH